MNRGFLNSTKAKKAIQVPLSSKQAEKFDAPAPSVDAVKTDMNLLDKTRCIKYDDERIVFCAEEVQDGARRYLQKSPSDCLNYEHHELVYTTIPARKEGDTLADNPDGWTECVITGRIKNEIYKTSGFPRPLVHPPEVRYRMDDSPGKGVGMFSTKTLQMGDLIFSERPIVVFPACERAADVWFDSLSEDEIGRFIVKEWNGVLRHMLRRLSPERAAAFWGLMNGHNSDVDDMRGIMMTNGYRTNGMDDDVPGAPSGSPHGAYESVCEKLCRINHSCQPNCERFWDKASFSYQIRATRKVEAGEELFIAYINVLEPYTKRRKSLDVYKFRCACEACHNPGPFDARRRAYNSAQISSKEVSNWAARDLYLPDDHVIKKALKQVQMLEDDKLENSPYYESHLIIILNSYLTLGDLAKSKEWGEKLGRWRSFRNGPEAAKKYLDEKFYGKENPLWRVRMRAKALEEGRAKEIV
ncbi:hypothetical protein PQX77_002720 [Marasmius sp. AFHP31]|nr:hypothetical protein PQX77_002720 [Marasmius sp. AFHP31]